TYFHKFYQTHGRSEPYPHTLVNYVAGLSKAESEAVSKWAPKKAPEGKKKDGLHSKFVYHIHLATLKMKAWKPAKAVEFKLVQAAPPSQPLIQQSPSVIDTSADADSEESNKVRMDLKKREEPKGMVKKARDMGSLVVAAIQEWLEEVAEKVKDEPSPKKALLGE